MTLATHRFLNRTLPVMRAVYELRPAERRRKPKVFERPFADMTEVRGRLNLRERDVFLEIENGRLRWAFNFSTNEKLFLRVYKPAVEHWVNPRRPLVETFDELLRKLFPNATFNAGTAESIPGMDFQETFNLSHHNMRSLLEAGLILSRDPDWGTSPTILLPSVIGFLKGRQLS